MDEPRRIGPYRVESRLGAGGMGAVYKAWDERLERWVALKSLHPDKEISPERRERLRREARTAAGLNHPAIAQVYDIVNDGVADWIVMELLEGRSVAALLLDGALPAEYAVSLARQIAEGLAAAHEAGVVHRDLKAENVMVTRGGRVKILDFGLAKVVDAARDVESLTQDGVVMGTSRSMSPEQAQGRGVDARSDLFSLGSLLYEMVTGHHPFQGSGPLDTMQRVVRHRPLPANRVNRDVPEALALLVEQLLEKDARNRPQSALEVAVALAALESQWQTETSDQSSLARLTAAARRRRLLRWRWLIAAAAAVVLALAVVGTVRWARRPPPTLYVAVPQPELAGDGASPTTELARRAVRTALLNSASSLRGVVVIDPHTVDSVSGTPQQVALATAADEVITAIVEPHEAMYSVILRRQRGHDGALLWTDELSAPTRQDPYLLLTDAIAAHLRSAYPRRRPRHPPATGTVNAEQMTEYLRLLIAIDDPKADLRPAEILDRLTTLRQQAPEFLDVATTEADLACHLYKTQQDAGFLKRARAATEHARELAPDDPRTLDSEFVVELAAGNVAAARAAVDRLTVVRPEDPNVLAERAQLATLAGKPETALSLYQQLAAMLPSWRNLWLVGNAELNSGHTTAARRDLERGLEAAPDNPYLMGKLAQLELIAGNPLRAVTLYTRLHTRNPQSVPWLANLGTAEMLVGRYDDASDHFRELLSMLPDNPVVTLNLADTLDLGGDSTGAEKLYRKVLDVTSASSSDPEVLGTRAQALAHLGEAREAVALAQEEVRHKPDDPFTAFSAALVYVVSGERTSATVQANRALELGLNPHWFDLPWFDPVREALGRPAGGRVTSAAADR